MLNYKVITASALIGATILTAHEVPKEPRKLILHLGGNPSRADKAIKLANSNPSALILISSESGDPVQYYVDRGIDEERIYQDITAWDTLTNFTATYKRVRETFDPDVLYIVTDGFHMERSMRIANAAYFLSGVELVPSPSSPIDFKEESKYVVGDTIRSWIWKLTGITLYKEEVRESHEKNYGMGRPKEWNEIPVALWIF